MMLWMGMTRINAQQPVQVNITIMQPVTPYLPQLRADITGGNYGGAEGLLTDKLIINLTNSGQSAKRIKLSARIERLSPKPAAVYLRPDYQPAAPIILNGGQMVRLDRKMIEDAFGNFSRSSLVFEDLNLSELRQNAVNYKLPEGIYRLCVTAYDYDKPGQSQPLSQIGVGCAIFNICYTASAPQFTMPVSGFMGKGRDFGLFTPTGQQIQFAWTPPATTCGLPLGMVSYDLEIKELFPGQVLSDAKRNPYVFRKGNIPTNLFILDTLMYPHVFKKGGRYTVQVKANIAKNASSPLEIANQGYSEWATLTYQPGENRRMATGPAAAPPPLPVAALGGGDQPSGSGEPVVVSKGLTGACENIPPVTDKTPSSADISGQTLTIGGFTMHVANAVATAGGGFKGTGTIRWAPLGVKTLFLNISFDKILVNKDRQVIQGAVNTVSDAKIPDWANLKSSTGIPSADQQIAAANDAINEVARPISNITGDSTLVNFPLGLDDADVAGAEGATLAIMGITFTPEGTDMRVLFNMKIADADPNLNSWLSLAATGLCIKRDGFSFEKGMLYLPEDKTVSLSSGYSLTFNKCTGGLAGTPVNTDNGTYLEWTPEQGLQRVVVNGRLVLAHDQALVALKSDGSIAEDPLSFSVQFDFKKWDDWVAAITSDAPFGFRSLDGFKITVPDGLWYDHSSKRNPTGLSQSDFPAVYAAKGWARDNAYQGLYVKNLNMQLPADFLTETGVAATFNFNHLFVDEHGLSTTIGVDSLLQAGRIGGWAFTIDRIFIAIEANNPTKDMQMKGRLGLPISSDALNYNCLLNTGSGKLQYAFSVSAPPGGLHVPMWAATLQLDQSSAVVIEKDSHGMKVSGELSGKLDIDIKEPVSVSFTAVSFSHMQIANRKPGGIEGFFFSPGNIEAGSGAGNPTALLEQLHPQQTEQPYYAKGGPYDNQEGYVPALEAGAPDATGKQIGGFGATITALEPVVSFTPEGNLKAGLAFDAGLDIGFGNADIVAGKTRLTISGEIDVKKWRPVPNSLSVTPERVYIEGDIRNVVHVSAKIDFLHNDQWGEGIDGAGRVTFMPGIEVDARVIFGKTKTAKGTAFDYFGFGAAVYKEKTGLVAIGPLIINGFGGGYFHNLTMDEVPEGSLSGLPETMEATDITRIKLKPSIGSDVFSANIGLSYINATVLKAKVALTGFINNGRLDSLRLTGKGDILSDGGTASKGMINVGVNMKYDFVHDQFDLYAALDVEFLAASAHIPIWIYAGYGDGADFSGESLEARAARQKDKSGFDFFLYLGNPDTLSASRVSGLNYRKMSLTLIDLKKSQTAGILEVFLGGQGYMCIGSILPKFPELPKEVADFLGYGLSEKQSSNASVTNLLSGPGGGFMFGADILGHVDLDLTIIRAYATAHMGFDVGLIHTQSTGCSPDGSLMGFNGWYAVGQVYAYLEMGVDLHIDVGIFDTDVTLAKVQVGAALQAGMPKPIWMNGRIRVVGEALGGLVHVDKTFTMEVNKPCYPAMDPLDNIKLIAEIGPSSKNVNVFGTPYIVFNLPMNKSDFTFYTLDEKGREKIRTYHFFMEELTVKADGVTEVKKPDFSSDGYTCYLTSDRTLKPEAKYTIDVRCRAEEYVNGNWIDPLNKNGKPEKRTQTESGKFETDKAPDVIDDKHVVISYPLNGQRYFLRKEFPGKQGSIVLDKQNDAYFTGVENPVYKTTFIPQEGGSNITGSYTVQYYMGKSRIVFDIPAGLKASTTYLLYFSVETGNAGVEKKKTTSLINLEKTSRHLLGQVGKQQRSTLRGNQAKGQDLDDPGVTLKALYQDVATKKLIDPGKINFPEGVHAQGKEIRIYEPTTGRNVYKMVFRTSQFGTFQEKMNSFGNTMSAFGVDQSGTALTGETATAGIKWASYKLNFSKGPEGFDVFEIKGLNRKVGEGIEAFTYNLPPLFNAELVFDPAKDNDKYMDPFYQSGYYLALGLYGFQVKYGAPSVRSSVGFRPDYSIRTDKTGYDPLLDIRQYLPGSGLYINYNIASPDHAPLSLVYERDKYFAHDVALVKNAYNYVWTHAVLISDKIKEVDSLTKVYKEKLKQVFNYVPEIENLIDNLDEQSVLAMARSYFNQTAATKYEWAIGDKADYLTSSAILAQGPYGTVEVPAGRQEAFWTTPGLIQTLNKLISPKTFKSLPETSTHKIRFYYGMSPATNYRWNAGTVDVMASNRTFDYLADYFQPLYMEAKSDKTMVTQQVDLSQENPRSSTETLKVRPFTILNL